MKFNWPLGFSELFPKNVLARFTSPFVAFPVPHPFVLFLSGFFRVRLPRSPSTPLFFFFLFFSFDLCALSTNIPCQSIPSEISNGIVPSDDITRRFCIFHRTLTIRTAMKLSSTDRYTRVDTEKKLVGTWPRSGRLTFRIFAKYSPATRSRYGLAYIVSGTHLVRPRSRYAPELLLSNAHVNGTVVSR